MSGDILQSQVDEIRKLMETRLRIRGKTLAQQVRKAGRLLPRNMRRDATYLVQAETVMAHPKLSRMVDGAKAHHAKTPIDTVIPTINKEVSKPVSANK